MALLFWETRRLRVIGIKTAVTAAYAVAVGVLAQLIWLGIGLGLAYSRGTTTHPTGFWPDMWGQGGRSVLLAVIAALLGFGLANLIRNTDAALGIGFVYFAVVETALRALLPTAQPWLVTDSAVALVMTGGLQIFLPGPTIDQATGSYTDFAPLVVTNLRGGLTLAAYTVILLAIGSWLFRRRDLA